MIGNLIKFALVFGVCYFIYKLKIHEKVYKAVNKFSNNTVEYNNRVKEKKRFMKFFNRQQKRNQEI